MDLGKMETISTHITSVHCVGDYWKLFSTVGDTISTMGDNISTVGVAQYSGA